MAGEWCDTTLGQVTDFLSGGTPSKDAPEYWGGSTPWVSAKDMKQFRLDDTQDHVTEDGVANCPMTFNQDVKALRPKPGVRDDFLPYLLLGNKERLINPKREFFKMEAEQAIAILRLLQIGRAHV